MHRAVIAFSLLLGAGALGLATPAHAINPDPENCHYETKCHWVTPPCPPNQYHKPRPCQAPYKVCTKEKVCVGD